MSYTVEVVYPDRAVVLECGAIDIWHQGKTLVCYLLHGGSRYFMLDKVIEFTVTESGD